MKTTRQTVIFPTRNRTRRGFGGANREAQPNRTKITVTGASGGIRRAVVRGLLDNGHEVRTFDPVSSPLELRERCEPHLHWNDLEELKDIKEKRACALV